MESIDADRVEVDWAAGRALLDDAVAPERCEYCNGPHPRYEHPWVFTFGHSVTHPDTGESLRWAYVVVVGTSRSADEQMRRLMGAVPAERYLDTLEAGVVRYGLTWVALPQRKDETP